MKRPLMVTLTLLTACASEETGPSSNNNNNSNSNNQQNVDPNAPKFYGQIQHLLQDRCNRCHHEGGAAPIDFTKYEDAKAWATIMARETQARRMPPWGAFETDACKPRFGFRDDERLTDDEIALISAWANGGAQEGDKSLARTSPDYPPTEIQTPDEVLAPKNPYVLTGTQDKYRCNVIDPGLTETKYVRAAQVLPGNDEVVHHVIVFTDPSGASDALADESGSYDCFGGPGFSNTQILLAWAPGAGPLALEESVGFRLDRGSKLVVQVHYHPSKTEHEPDSTKVQIKYATERPDWVLTTALIGNFDSNAADDVGHLLPGMNDRDGVEFRIPAGAQNHEEKLTFTLPEMLDGTPIPDLRIAFVGTHMHYVGTGMRIELDRAEPLTDEPSTECLVETPQWDFRWQRGYAYDVALRDAPRFVPGDTLRMRCIYDNSMSNPFVVEALAAQNMSSPHDVLLGEATLDEMCLAVLGVAFENPF